VSTIDYSLVGFGEVLVRIRATLEQSGLTCSKYIIDHSGNTASHLVNETFSLDIQTANEDIYRDASPLRIGHAVGIVVVWKNLPANDQFAALVSELANEENLIRPVLLQTNTAEMRAYYVATARTLSPSREYLLTRITLRVVHDWYGEPLE
jgi:hypothetical protein